MKVLFSGLDGMDTKKWMMLLHAGRGLAPMEAWPVYIVHYMSSWINILHCFR